MDKPESMCPLSSFGMGEPAEAEVAQSLDCLAAALPSPACREVAVCASVMGGGSVHSESNLKTLSQHSWDMHGDDSA